MNRKKYEELEERILSLSVKDPIELKNIILELLKELASHTHAYKPPPRLK
jgi:hypothetical protein